MLVARLDSAGDVLLAGPAVRAVAAGVGLDADADAVRAALGTFAGTHSAREGGTM